MKKILKIYFNNNNHEWIKDLNNNDHKSISIQMIKHVKFIKSNNNNSEIVMELEIKKWMLDFNGNFDTGVLFVLLDELTYWSVVSKEHKNGVTSDQS